MYILIILNAIEKNYNDSTLTDSSEVLQTKTVYQLCIRLLLHTMFDVVAYLESPTLPY